MDPAAERVTDYDSPMALPTAYLTSFKNAEPIFKAIQAAQAPPRFTQKFLEGLGFPNANDRMMINVLKALGFLDDTGVPTSMYHEYLDQTQSALVLATGIRSAYADLYSVNREAHSMTAAEVKNKLKTLSAGKFTDRVLTQMSGTFAALAKLADFSQAPGAVDALDEAENEAEAASVLGTDPLPKHVSSPRIGGLVYNINLHLPDSRDPAVYDALFKSLKQHLLS